MTTFYDNKEVIWVLLPKEGSELKHTDLLLYSYLSYHHAYDCTKSIRRAADDTGLSPNTVVACTARLEEHGYLKDGIPQHRQDKFYNRKSKSDKWFDRVRFWKTLLPSTQSILSLADAMVFSFLLHRYLFQNDSNTETTATYIANGTGLCRKTVATSLEHLEEVQLFRKLGKRMAMPSCLTGIQLSWFRTQNKPDEDFSIDTFTPDDAKVIETVLDNHSVQQDFEIAPIDVMKYIQDLTGGSLEGVEVGMVAGKIWRMAERENPDWKRADDWRDIVREKYRSLTNEKGT